MNVNIVTTDPAYSTLNTLTPGMYSLAAINILFGLAGVLSFIFLLWGGIQWITAGGDKDAVEKGRRRIMQALTGIAIVFSGYAIIYIIRVLFQVNVLQIVLQALSSYQ